MDDDGYKCVEAEGNVEDEGRFGIEEEGGFVGCLVIYDIESQARWKKDEFRSDGKGGKRVCMLCWVRMGTRVLKREGKQKDDWKDGLFRARSWYKEEKLCRMKAELRTEPPLADVVIENLILSGSKAR